MKRRVKCPVCDTVFFTYHKNQQFCSQKCRARRKIPKQLANREWLNDLYTVKQVSATDIALLLHCNYNVVYRALHELGIPVRAGKFKEGSNHQQWKGGSIIRHGYRLIYCFDHPSRQDTRTGRDYVPEHRLVMEAHLGRYLSADEVVHHINHDTLDNRIENLEVMTASEHLRLHWSEDKTSPSRPGQRPLPPDRWAIKYSECIECGTSEIPHGGLGLCKRCYNRQLLASRASTNK